MKFFYINNSACTSCDRCAESCPTGAICVAGDRRFINYDRCNSCGNCLKTCSMDAVTLRSLDEVVAGMEKTEQHKNYIERLEHELILLKQQVREANGSMAAMIEGFPVAVFVADSRMRVVMAGKAFSGMVPPDPLAGSEGSAGLAGRDLGTILDNSALRGLEAMAAGRKAGSLLAEISGKQVSLSFVPLYGGWFMCALRDLADGGAIGHEVAVKLREAIEQQLATVQKVGFLLGEEMSAAVAGLSSVVEMISPSPKGGGVR